MTPRLKRREKRLAEIRENALDLVIEDGPSSFSIHRLAERLDLTVGALYRYFDSVDHLMMAIQIDVLDGFDAYLGRVVAMLEDATPLERVVGVCHAYLALRELQPERFRLIGRFVSSPDPLFDDAAARDAMEPTLRLLGHLAGAIAGAQEAGELEGGDAMERAILGWSSIQGLVERSKLGRLAPELFDTVRLETALVSTLLRGWGASKPAARAALEALPDDEFFRRALKREDVN